MEQDNTKSQIPLRARRDRMASLLGIGTPFPLRDLPLIHNQKAQFGQELEITISHSQERVRYTLHDANQMRLSPPAEGVEGQEGPLVFKTPPIRQDVTFTLLAERLAENGQPAVVAQNFLHHTIVLRVGIDNSVIAFIKNEKAEQFPARAWIDYGRSVDIQVGSLAPPPQGFSAPAQEEVTYSLVSRLFKDALGQSAREEEVLSVDVPGDDRLEVEKDGKRTEPPLFRTRALEESTEVEVKAYEKGAPDIFDYLDRKLQVFVRPNPKRETAEVQLADQFILPGEENKVILNKVSPSEGYQLFVRFAEQQDYQADGTPLLLPPDGPETHRISSEPVLLSHRLLKGIQLLLAAGGLNEEGKRLLPDVRNRLAAPAPHLPPNLLQETMKTLEAAENRAQWPEEEVPWVEAPVELHIPSGLLTRDCSFYIRAFKWDNAFQGDPGASLWLNQAFTIQVMNPGLHLAISNNTPEAAGANAADSTEARIDFHGTIGIQLGLPASQENPANWREARTQRGLSYLAVADREGVETPVTNTVEGNGQLLQLQQLEDFKFEEDTQIRVKAFQTARPEKELFLDTTLQVWVKPNPALSATLSNAVIPYDAQAVITIEPVQASVDYELWGRRLDLLEYSPAGELEVADHRTLEKLEKIGSLQSGEDVSKLSFETGPQQEDAVFVIRAAKRDESNGEALILDTPLVLRVEPDLKPEVSMAGSPVAAGVAGIVLVDKTQQGVKYQLRISGDTPQAAGRPGYDLSDRGIGGIRRRREYGMRLEIDFKVGRGTDSPPTMFSGTELALPTGPLSETTTFEVVAIKSYTKLEAVLPQTVTIAVEASDGE